MEIWRKELYHHGILGMRWGVRRYQNSDGSLTPAGRKHYGVKETIKSIGKASGDTLKKELNDRYGQTSYERQSKEYKKAEQNIKEYIDKKKEEDRKKREKKAIEDAKKFSNSHARLEDTTRVLVGDLKPGVVKVVPPEVKKDYERQLKTLQKMDKTFKRKYSDVYSDIITKDGKEYVYTLFRDKKYGFGAEYITQLHTTIDGNWYDET